MNVSAWAATQSVDCLEVIDRMIPDYVQDKDIESVRRKKLRQRRGHGSSRTGSSSSFWKVVGAALVVIALAMLAPGPIDYFVASVGARVGFAMGGPIGAIIGAFVGVVVYNVAALIVLGIGTWLVANG